MRRALVLLGVALAALATGGLALAAFTQTAATRLTAVRAGQSTGIVADVHASDPAALGGKPRSVRQLTITFPVGTRFDLDTPLVSDCRVSLRRLAAEFGPSCPGRSRIGRGTAVANIAPFTPATVTETVSVYVRGSRRAILIVKPKLPGAPTEIMNVAAAGRRLTVDVPRLIWGKLIDVVLVSLKLDVPRLGTGSSALITAGRCTDGRFAIAQRFRYADRGVVDVASFSACRP